MISELLERGIRGQEQELGVPLDYLRHMARHSPASVMKLGLLKPLASHRRRLPADVLHIARLQAILVEDCGTCAQIEVNLARRDGVPPEVLRAVLAQQIEDLPEDLADVARFAWAIAEGATDGDELRERLRARHGEEGLIELALAIASARVFPTLKRALGFAGQCAIKPLAIPA